MPGRLEPLRKRLADANGSISFDQTDAYLIEGSFLEPWVPIPGAGG